MGKVRPFFLAFKNYRELTRRLRCDGRLELPRPDRCGCCRGNCGFVKDGHYPRDFVFVDTVISGVWVQQYHCKDLPKNPRFSALGMFQEPRAHYTVPFRGAVLDRVFKEGQSRRSAWRAMRKTRGGRSLARSTVWAWCARFEERAAGHASALRAHLGQRLSDLEVRIRGDPSLFLRAARVAFGLYRQWSSERFWEWLHDLLFRAAGRHLLSA